MSFSRTNTIMNEGETAIVYLSFNQLYPIVLQTGLLFHSKYGSIKHNDIIGKRFGTKFQTNKGGSVYILQPSPEMWTICLPHRTQIIYTPNISVITLQLELKPGSVVVESGLSA
jgi:tRNA (adenine57-N1/adenine58-N1)-methyltransferase